jgi:hypothetical protein
MSDNEGGIFGGEPQPNVIELPKRRRLIFYDEIGNQLAGKPYVVKGVAALGEVSGLIGAPGAGKSALTNEIAIHVAHNRVWRGHRVAGTGVLFLPTERATLIERRIAAHRERDKLPDKLPIAIAGQTINLMDPKCAPTISALIAQAEQRCGQPFRLAIIDTHGKAMAAGGGDEMTARDQNIAAVNMRRIIEARDGLLHILSVGHFGKDHSKGERGSNARLGDLDVEIQITGDNIKTAKITKGNDQEQAVLTNFALEPFEFGVDAEGDPVRTWIVSPQDFPHGPNRQKLTDRQARARQALADTIIKRGRPAPAEFQLPGHIKVVRLKEWEAELKHQHVIEGANPRARFVELRDNLAARHLIGIRDGHAWLV